MKTEGVWIHKGSCLENQFYFGRLRQLLNHSTATHVSVATDKQLVNVMAFPGVRRCNGHHCVA